MDAAAPAAAGTVEKASASGRSALWRLAAGSLLVAAFGAVMKLVFFPYPIIDGDTGLLVGGAARLSACLQAGVERCPDIFHFPVLQYLQAVVLLRRGLDGTAVLRFYTHVSAVGFIGALLLGAGFLWRREQRVGAVFFLLALLSSFGIWHFNATYGEAAGALLITAFTVSALWRRSALLLGALAALSALTKETSAPFLLALGALPLLRDEGPWPARLRRDARHLAALLVGAGLGVAVNTAFNDYRFGAWSNTFLLDPTLQVPTLAQHLFHVAGLWFSPNGGLLPFAPLLIIALAGLALAGWRGPHRLVALVPLALLVVLTLGLGRWFSPFGWWTWGPRLCLSWLPALLLVALYFHGQHLEPVAARVLKLPPAALALAGALAIASAPHVQMLRDPGLFYGFFDGNRDCPRLFDVRGTQAEFYTCHNAMIFPRHEFLLAQTYEHMNDPSSQWPLALYGLLLVALTLWLRHETRVRPRPP